MYFRRRPRFARILPSTTLLLFFLGLVAFMVGLPWQAFNGGRVEGGDPPTNCGTERWPVKTGTDADVYSMDLWDVWPTSVAEMGSWPRPRTFPANNRVDPYEFYIWTVNATLVEFKRETDSDYHLVLADDQGNTIIAEIPDPNCVGAGSPFADYIANARAEMDAVFNVTTTFHYAYVPVTVIGVAFFDIAHNQTGHAPNYIELHPVLDIQFD
jgi:hypothetical protein